MVLFAVAKLLPTVYEKNFVANDTIDEILFVSLLTVITILPETGPCVKRNSGKTNSSKYRCLKLFYRLSCTFLILEQLFEKGLKIADL
jgi:hypothetical protein